MKPHIKDRIIADLKARKIDGLLTAEIAKKYKVTTGQVFYLLNRLYKASFKSDCGAILCRNCGNETDDSIRHTHWFFT